MKNAKRCLAILLAVTLLCSNGVSQLGTIVSASELETTEEAQPKEDAVVEQAEETKEDTGKATVEGVTPEEERGESSAQDAETANVPKAAAQEGQNEANVPEAAPATVAPTTVAPTTATPATVTPATAVPAAEGAGQAEEATAPEVQTYNVKINKSELDGGQIKVWGSDNTQVDVTEYDGNNQYVKEVKEGEEFNFQITLNDGFEIAQVKVNGNAFDPAKTEGNVITYKVAGINEEKVIDVTYNKIETPAEEKAAEEPKTEDETKVEEPAAEETAEPEDNSVNTASLNENVSTVANTDTNRTVRVGQTITLDSSDKENKRYGYTHQWTVTDSKIVRLNATSGTSITVTGLKAGNTSVIDTYTWHWFGIKREKKTYTITVLPKVEPTGIGIDGSDTVTQFKTMQLTAKLTPADASGTVTWSSDNEEILTVNEDGLVTGKRQGSATVTASVQGTAKKTLTATKTIKVVKNETTTGNYIQTAAVYYLKDPSQDATSNASDAWGPSYVGTAQVNIEGATWQQYNGEDKNCFDNVDQRVISWSNGSNVVPKNNQAWQLIFDAFKNATQNDLGVEITEADVENIILEPAKISINNATDSVHPISTHLDCNVKLICKKVATVKYHLWDAGETTWEFLGAKNYLIRDDSTTQPGDVTDKEFPETKQIGDVTYTFSGWYTDKSLTIPVSFPAQVTKNVDYYAKYVAGYYVKYDLQGGTFGNDSSLQEKHNVDTEVVVKEQQPTRAGYKFTGWKVEGLENIASLNSGESFTMPNGNVTLTAQWEEQKIENFITLNTTDVEHVYDGTAYSAEIATVNGKVAGVDITDVKIEYSVDGQTWTENPSEITATNVSDITVNVRVSSEGNYNGYVTGKEKLTITKRPITITGDGWASDQAYTGNEYKKTGYTVEEANAENTSGLVAGQKVNTSYEIKGTKVGTYTGAFGEKFEIKTEGGAFGIGAKDVTANYTVTKTPGTLNITKAKIAQYVTLTPVEVKKVYDGKAHVAGTATATDTNGNDLKIEYQKADGSWTEDPSKITATNVSDITVNVRVSSEGNYDGYVTGKEKLTITARPITITGDGWASDQAYTGNEYKKTTYTAEEANAENTRGLVAGQTAEVVYELKGTNVGNYTGTFGTAVIKKGEEDVTANYVVTKTPGTLNITKAKIAQYITLTPVEVKKVYDGKAHAAGTATATDTNGNDLKIEYQKADGSWTEDPSEITATNVSDSKIVNVRVSAGNYEGYVNGTEELTITARPITITGDGWASDQSYTGNEYKKTTYTVEEANAENTRGLVAGQKVNTSYEIKGTNAGTYTGAFGEKFEIKTAGGAFGIGAEDVTANYAVTKIPGKLTITKAEIAQYVTLTPTDVKKTYDGNVYAAGTATASDTNGNDLKIE